MSGEGTRASFIARYHTLLRRSAWDDERGRSLILASLARSIGPLLPADASTPILDVGCGEGALLTYLDRRGFTQLSGFDLSPENAGLCRDAGLGFVAVHDALDVASFEPGRRYGVIFLLDLIEHLRKEDALPFLRAVRERLAPGGSIVLRTPNMASILGALERYGDITHEWGLTERSVTDLVVAAGFRREEIEVRPAWEAATMLGRLREVYLRLLHRIVYLSAGRARPHVPTPNLLVRAVAR